MLLKGYKKSSIREQTRKRRSEIKGHAENCQRDDGDNKVTCEKVSLWRWHGK